MSVPPMKMFEMSWRAKGVCDGDTSLESMARSLEAAAWQLRKLAKAGFALAERVTDDDATLMTNDPLLAAQYQMTVREED